MKIEKVLETVFLQKWKTTALILENRIVVMLFHGRYIDQHECFKHIYEHCPRWVQTSESSRKANRLGNPGGFKDPIQPYEDLYDDLLIYAQNKFGNEFKHHGRII